MVLSEECDTNNVTTARKEISIKIWCVFSIDPSLDVSRGLRLTRVGVLDSGNELLRIWEIKIIFSICKV